MPTCSGSRLTFATAAALGEHIFHSDAIVRHGGPATSPVRALRSALEPLLKALAGQLETLLLVETMRVESNGATGQPHPVAPLSASERLDRSEQFRANAPTTQVATHVHALEFTA